MIHEPPSGYEIAREGEIIHNTWRVYINEAWAPTRCNGRRIGQIGTRDALTLRCFPYAKPAEEKDGAE